MKGIKILFKRGDVMQEFKYIYGPVPSRRLGLSLGISPIPAKYCNYSCIYCQLGRTMNLMNNRYNFFQIEDILDELNEYLKENIKYNVVTIVGEGEPTLYSNLGELIKRIKDITTKPIVVITNGALLSDENVRLELMNADIVMPSLDAIDEEHFRKINRPHKSVQFINVINGLRLFSERFNGQLWIETMLLGGINDDHNSLLKLKTILNTIQYDRLYINTPVRPPAERYVVEPSTENLKMATEILGGIAIDQLVSPEFYSEISDDYAAIKSIIKRHPMNQYEIESFLVSRKIHDSTDIFDKLEHDNEVEVLTYKSYKTYRLILNRMKNHL